MNELCEFAAGIVLFNPELEKLKEAINSVIAQCQKVFIVDNKGIATALNQVCQRAYVEGYNWILTMDQDSVCPVNMMDEYKKYVNDSKIGMLCSVVYDRNCSKMLVHASANITEVAECITSGSLLRLSVWKQLNGFDERMFIDGVDFDMCHRIIQAGYKVCCVENVVLVHELGKMEIHRIFGWKIIVKNHSAFRKYYIARNTIYLAQKERTSVFIALLHNLKLFLICVLFEKEKKEKVKRIWEGTVDGCRDGSSVIINRWEG